MQVLAKYYKLVDFGFRWWFRALVGFRFRSLRVNSLGLIAAPSAVFLTAVSWTKGRDRIWRTSLDIDSWETGPIVDSKAEVVLITRCFRILTRASSAWSFCSSNRSSLLKINDGICTKRLFMRSIFLVA